MNSTINCKANQSFTARSPQVKDAQWIARKVRSFPHISTTRIAAPMWDLEEQNLGLYDRFMSKKPFERFVVRDKHEAKLVKLFAWQKRIVQRLANARREWEIGRKGDYRRAGNILGMFKYEKIGNCGEDAFLSGTIAKINGIENVYTSKLKVDDWGIDHVVCVFNPDGSKFDGNIKNDTIIIDSWIGEADFAKNMFVKYKNLYQKFFASLKPNSKISFDEIIPINFSEEDKLLLSLKHSDFNYKSSTREFMPKK